MYVISLFDIISVIVPDPRTLLWIPASAVEAATVKPKVTITLLANSVGIFFINSNPNFINTPRGLPKKVSNGSILDRWDFGNFLSFDSQTSCEKWWIVY